MSTSILLIFSAFLHALWNSLAKNHKHPPTKIFGILCFAAVISVFFIPSFEGAHFPNSLALLWAVLAGFAEGGYFVSLGRALDSSKFGVAYVVMRGLAMILVWVLSALLQEESINLKILSAIVLVLLGLYFTTFKPQDTQGSPSKGFFEFFKNFSEFKWAFFCACFIAGYHFFYGHSLKNGARPSTLFSLSLWISIPLTYYFGKSLFLKNLKSIFKMEWKSFLIAGLVCTLSFLFFLKGLQNSGAGAALTLRNSSVIFAQGLALTIGEKVGAKQWLGAILVVLGISLVSE